MQHLIVPVFEKYLFDFPFVECEIAFTITDAHIQKKRKSKIVQIIVFVCIQFVTLIPNVNQT